MKDRLFLEILKTALCGEQMPCDTQISCEEMDEIIRLSQLHKMLPMVYDSLYPICPYEDAMQEEIRRCSKLLVMQQTIREESFLRVYKALQEKGLEPIVVKGAVCRSLYPKPELRPSADEDLFIKAEEAEAYDTALTSLGFRKQEKRSEDYYETSYFSDEGLHIEVHTSLFSTQSDYFLKWNELFSGAEDTAVHIEAGSVLVRTLSPTDHLLFLILHALKHFIHSGVGIRQVCDIMMFAQHYGDTLDWNYVCSKLYSLGAEKFTAGVFAIGTKYLGFDEKKSRYPHKLKRLRVKEELLLRDILCAGVYGGSTMSRRHSGSVTFSAVQGKSKSFIFRLFPRAKDLDRRYKYAQDRPLLLPVAWIHRMADYLAQVSKKEENTPLEALRTGKERLELLRSFGLLSEEQRN